MRLSRDVWEKHYSDQFAVNRLQWASQPLVQQASLPRFLRMVANLLQLELGWID